MIFGEMFAGDDMTDKLKKQAMLAFLLYLVFGCGILISSQMKSAIYYFVMRYVPAGRD